MTLQMVLARLREAGIRLRSDEGQLVVTGQRDRVDGALLEALRGHKAALLELLAREGGEWGGAPPPITPAMLPLVELTQAEIDRIVAEVPGGAANVQDIYPLAPLQEGILFHHLMARDGDPYLLAGILAFDGRGLLQAYLDALQAVVDRHDILRTAVAWEGLAEPVQVVWRTAPLPVQELALDPRDGDVAAQLHERFHPRRHRIELTRAPLLRLHFAHDAAHDRWVLLQRMHHLVDDNTSLRFLRAEIGAHLQGRAHELPPPLPFRNFVAQVRLGVSREAHEAYFRALLGDVDEPTAPFGLLDAWGDGSGIEEAGLAVDGELAGRLRARAQALGVSAASVFHVAWALVAARASGRDDVVFGTVLFGRMRGGEGAHRAMGPFINTLPVRVRLGAAGVEAGVRAMHAQLADLLVHEHASLPLAQRSSGVRAPAPLFTSLLNYRHAGGGRKERAAPGGEQPAVRQLLSEERTNYPLALSVNDGGDAGLGLQAQTPASVGAARVCAMVHRALEGLVEALESAPDRAVGTIDVLPEAERRRVVEEWSGTEAPHLGGPCIHELFEAQAERTPDAVAVVFGDEALSYAELDRRSNRLAHHLRGLGIGAEARVGVCLERSLEMVVGLLGVLKAGGAYVPLDPAHPPERLAGMLDDAGARLVVSSSALAAGFPPGGAQVLRLDGARERIAAESDAPPGRTTLPGALAYVVFTSGSTGRPRGVAVPHAALANHMAWMQRAFPLAPDDRVLQKTPVGFDASVWEFWAPLLAGATLVVAAPGVHRDPAALLRAVEDGRITVLQLVPSMLGALLEHGGLDRCAALRRLFCGGEALPAEAAARVREALPGAGIVNLYGPTESTIDATSHAFAGGGAGATVPIGRAVDGVRTYVLDPQAGPVPAGVAGELCLGGAQLARGYLGRPEWTAERFVPDGLSGGTGARLYRTGDRVRWLASGELEFLGRVDHQVKVRGFRVEPGEVEARLREHPAVREAVVVAREDAPGDRRLVAYWVGEEDAGAEALRRHVGERLPEHMVPATCVRLERLPLSPNGKVDRGALPAPAGDAYARRGYEAPVGEAEQAMAEIWSEVLGVERVGRRDHFFELGGHSLLAVQVVSRARRATGAEVRVGDLFERPVLADFARGAREDLPGGATAAGAGASHAEGGPDVPVPVRTTGTERPLFLVHDGHASIAYAQLLGWQVDAGVPVYALPPLLDPGCPLRTVPDMAARLVRMIRSVQPAGPYRLAGYSFGGLLAYEAAAQLIAGDQEVEFLGLIDTSHPGADGQGTATTQPDLSQALRILGAGQGTGAWPESTLREVASAWDPADPGALLRAARDAGLFTGRSSAERAGRLLQEKWVYPLARRDYTPPGIPVPVCYFEAVQKTGAGPCRGWRAVLADTSIRVTPVPGTHESMIGPVHVPALGRALSSEIARAAKDHYGRQPSALGTR